MDNELFLSVVIPAYNEASNMQGGAMATVADYFKTQPYPYEIILVDDGSADNTATLLEAYVKSDPNFRLIKNRHLGKAGAVKAGVDAARGKYILFTDFDQATPPEEIEKLLPFVEKRAYDIAIGSREIMGSKRENEPWHRHIMGKGFNIVVQILAVRNIHDTQCGFKLFKTAIAKELFNELLVYRMQDKVVKGPRVTGFDVELLFLAQKRGYKIAEIPIFWHYVKTDRVSPISESAKIFMEVVRIRLNDLMGAYAKQKSQS